MYFFAFIIRQLTLSQLTNPLFWDDPFSRSNFRRMKSFLNKIRSYCKERKKSDKKLSIKEGSRLTRCFSFFCQRESSQSVGNLCHSNHGDDSNSSSSNIQYTSRMTSTNNFCRQNRNSCRTWTILPIKLFLLF